MTEAIMNTLADAADIKDLHKGLQAFECSLNAVQSGNVVTDAMSGQPHIPALSAFLELITNYWLKSAVSFDSGFRALNKYKSLPDPRVRYLVGRGHCLAVRHFLRQGDIKTGEEHASLASSIAEFINSPYLKAETLEVIARIRSTTCEWNIAMEILDQALGVYRSFELKDLPGEARTWEARGQLLFDWGRFARANQDLENCINLWRDCFHEHGFIETQLLRAHLYYHTRDDESCRKILMEAAEHCRALDYGRGLGKAKRYLGKLLLREGKWEEAFNLFKESQDIFDKIGDPAGSARACLSLARANMEGKKYNEALKCYEQAESKFCEMNDMTRKATSLVTKGLVLARMGPGKKDQVITIFNEALDIFLKHKDQRHISSAQFEIAQQYRQWGDYERASEYLEESIRIASEMHAERLVDRYRTENFVVNADKYYSLMLEAKRQRELIYSLLNFGMHDIGNMVQDLVGPIDILRTPASTQTQKKDAGDRARLGSKYLINICNGLVGVAKAGDGKFHMKKEVQLLKTIVDDILELMKTHLVDNKITAKNTIPVNLEVHADCVHLTRVLMNLVGNAAKFSKNETITISAGKMTGHRCGNNKCVRITVADTGYGIPVEMREKVFDLFEQVEGTRELEEQKGLTGMAERGYGLGLAYCSLVVRSHSGAIWVDPVLTCKKEEDKKNPDRQGTVIHFCLPS